MNKKQIEQLIRIRGFILEDTDFEFPKRKSPIDTVRVEWYNLTDDREKRRYWNKLEKLFKSLETELSWKDEDIEKLNKIIRKQLMDYFVFSIIFLLLGWWLF